VVYRDGGALVPEQILPAPATVLEAFAALTRNGDLQNNLVVSLSRVTYGFGAGATAGLLFGAGMGFSDRSRGWYVPPF